MLRRNSSHKALCKIRVLNRASVKHSLPAFLFQWLHPQRPHDLSHGHGRIFSVLIFLFGMAVKIFLEPVMQVNFIGQPWVYGAPVGRFAFLVVGRASMDMKLGIMGVIVGSRQFSARLVRLLFFTLDPCTRAPYS